MMQAYDIVGLNNENVLNIFFIHNKSLNSLVILQCINSSEVIRHNGTIVGWEWLFGNPPSGYDCMWPFLHWKNNGEIGFNNGFDRKKLT